MSIYEYLGIDPSFKFNEEVSRYTKLLMKKLLEEYRGFDGFKVLVDVGGGCGFSVAAIASKNPHIKCINYDLPYVVADAPSYQGVEHVGGDMFTSVPKADGIMLKSVLHNWGDDYCEKILKNCYDALPSIGKLVVVDWVLPEVPENDISSHIVLAQDLLMMAQHPGGKERTLNEFKVMAYKLGFTKLEVHNCIFNMHVMEFHKSA